MPQSDRQREYEVYLRSWHWRQMRLLALDDADGRCAVCNSTKNLDVHHRTHERRGHERLTDLLVLCRQEGIMSVEDGIKAMRGEDER